MANETYIITPADGNPTREFSVSPHTTNGPISPTSQTLDSSAVAIDTSLLFYGKGKNDYGDRIQENLLHLMEHFSGDTEPVKPINGQIWYDSNDDMLKIFNILSLEITEIVGNDLTLKLPGTAGALYQTLINDALLLRFSGGFKFNVYEILTKNLIGEYIASSSAVGIDDTEIVVTLLSSSGLTVLAPPTTPFESIGMWLPFGQLSSAAIANLDDLTPTIFPSLIAPTDVLNVGDYRITNVANPIDLKDAVNKDYADNAFVNITGDIMTGNLTINADLIVNGNQTISNTLSFGPAGEIDMLGRPIFNLPAPANPDDPATKDYVDLNFVELIGDTMTGTLILTGQPGQNGNPGAPGLTDAATVDFVNSATGGIALSIIPPLTDLDVIVYNNTLAVWENKPQSDLDVGLLDGLDSTEFIREVGAGTITSGTLILQSQPGQDGFPGLTLGDHAATVQHVTDEITANNAVFFPAGVDRYVTSGSYDGILDELTLNRSDIPNTVIITGIAAGVGTAINNTNAVNHDIIPLQEDDGDYLESVWANDPAFPTIILNKVIESMSESMKRMQRRNLQGIITSDARITPYDIDALLGLSFTTGYNSLMIFINGQKVVADSRGFQEAAPTLVSGAYPSSSTGLTNDPTVFSFNISVDGAPNQLIGVVGANSQNYQLLREEINLVLTGARCVVHEGVLSFISDSSGATSTISITDVDLFSSLSNSVVIDPAVPGVTYDYFEIGAYGDTNADQFQFNAPVPPVGARIEVLIINTGGAPNLLGFEF